MKKQVLKLDCDGVLRDCVTPLLNIYNNMYNDNIKHSNITTWNMSEFLGKNATYPDFFNSFPKEIFQDGRLYDEKTVDILNRVKEFYNIHIVTHQFKGLEVYTVKWLYNNKIPYDYLSFVKDKTQIKGDVLLDDAEHNLEDSCENNEIAVCFDQPWNKNWKGLRIKKLEDLIR